MNTSITTLTGNITEYGFACGYVQSVSTDTLSKELYKEHGVYHVRSSNNNSPSLNTDFSGGSRSHVFLLWETFNKLVDARKLYNAIK